MPNDPKYVRLADHLADSALADVQGGSGWSISGRQVKEFPSVDEQVRFVRSQLVHGLLEPASKAELDEMKKTDDELAALAASFEEETPANGRPTGRGGRAKRSAGLQEAQLQERAAAGAQALAEARSSDSEDESE
jgi:hypothetical protein